MRRTTAITVACMTAAALTVTACGRSAENGGTTAGQTGAAVSTGKATGTITVWAMGAEGDNLPKLTKDFEAANPGVKVQVTAIPWDAAHDKFTASIASGNTPDVAMVGTTWMGEFASSDAIDPTPAQIDTSAFFEGAQKTTEVNGTSYGIPWYVETRVLFYRTDLAKKAGYDSVPTDAQGLKDMAKAMQTKAGAQYGIGLQAGGEGSWQTLMPFAWSDGADLTKDGGKAYNFDSPEMVKAAKYYQSYFTDGISNKSAPATPTTEPDFASGKVPMFISGPWMMSAVEKVGGAGFKDKYNVAPIPAGSAGSSSFVGGSNFVVFKNTKNRDTAWKFVQWLADPKVQSKWYTISTDLPSVKSAWQDPALASDKKLAVFGKQLETAKAPPSFPTWEQAVKGLDTEMEKITKTGEDPATGLKTAQQQAESIGTGM
ncbi:sugar ABC transporter substrate-binding protein [Terrabacter sp. 2TAF16]|jgi:multiple sugar transport system substrate-binding protein|uniref:sugar ABC transporter substrate-binding protein n=2 Tax=unclassified Terrabacter TaxID=2630222 RepID=UPI003F9A5436